MAPVEDLSLRRAGARKLAVATVVFSVFTNLLMLTGPLFMLQVYDRVLGSRSEETLLALSILVTGLFALYGVLEWARGRVMARAAARFHEALGPRVFRATVERSAGRGGGGAASSALADLEAMRGFIASPGLLALLDIPWTPLFIGAIFILHPVLGFIGIAGGAILVLTTVLNQLTTRGARDRALSSGLTAQRFAQSAEHGGAFVRAQGMLPAMLARWQKMHTSAAADSMTAQDRTGSFSAFTRAFRFFLQSAMLAVGALLVLQGSMTGGGMIAGSILLGRALAPIEQTIGQWQVLQRARQGRRRLTEFLATVPEKPAPLALPDPEAHLRVRNLTLAGEPGRPPILQGVSFDVRPGEALGVIGHSGAGKTTLARLLIGLTPATQGEVRLGGAALDQYGGDLGRHLGYLPQDVAMFEGTIAENIARMAVEIDPAAVVAAATKARVHDVILQLPEGYDTRLTQDDPRLSGGQRQRVALARAFYGEPRVLILDEPNSALDADGSEALAAAIRDLTAAGGAAVVMTHRPTAISACDRLLVLDGGKVAAYGPKNEVLRAQLKNSDAVMQAANRKAGAVAGRNAARPAPAPVPVPAPGPGPATAPIPAPETGRSMTLQQPTQIVTGGSR